MIAVANIDGFIVKVCHVYEREHGPNDEDSFRGTVNTEKFEYYVEHFLSPSLGNYALKEPRSIVFLDNAIIHVGLKILFVPLLVVQLLQYVHSNILS